MARGAQHGGCESAAKPGELGTAVLLVAHGSADPRAAASTRALARAVAAQRPGLDVRTSYLDHAGPRPTGCCSTCSASGTAQRWWCRCC